jgi:hypothetical protein
VPPGGYSPGGGDAGSGWTASGEGAGVQGGYGAGAGAGYGARAQAGLPPTGYPPTRPPGQRPPGKAPKPPRRNRPKRTRKGVKALVAGLAAAVLVVGAGITYVVVTRDEAGTTSRLNAEGNLGLNADYLATLPYDFAEPELIKPTQRIRLKFDGDVNVRDFGNIDPLSTSEDPTLLFNDLVSLWADPELTEPLPFYVPDDPDGKPFSTLMIWPSTRWDRGNLSSEHEGERVLSDRWWHCDVVYVAQTRGRDGSKLERPLVTPMVIDRAKNSVLPAVEFTYTMATDGTVDFSWAAVEGAASYYVIVRRETRFVLDDTKGELIPQTEAGMALGYTRIIETGKAGVVNSKQDLAPGMRGYGYKTANAVFAATIYDEDQAANTRAILEQDPLYTYRTPPEFDQSKNDRLSFTVIAVGADLKSFSLPQWHDATTFLAGLPIQVAAYGLSELSSDCSVLGVDAAAWAECYSRLPVTMGDGHTGLAPIEFDYDGAYLDRKYGELEITLVMAAASEITHDAVLWDAPDDWREQLEAGLAAAKATWNGTGMLPNFAYEETDWEEALKLSEGQVPVSTIPDVPYPVNGSSELVQFIAANLIAGNYYFDLTKYASADQSALWFSNAVNEAVMQNPYILGWAPVTKVIGYYSLDEEILGTVHFPAQYLEPEVREQMQQEMLQTAQSAVAEVTSPNMSDWDKAFALNKWLAAHAEYDYEAYEAIENLPLHYGEEMREFIKEYPYNQIAYGTLISGEGVCSSYAAAYKVLLDEAGIDAVVVTGNLMRDYGLHAWNKVFMEGKWQIVDPTWSDDANGSEAKLSEYFGLTDAESERMESGDWISESRSKYAAN